MDNVVAKEIDGILYRARFKGMAYAVDLDDKMQRGMSQIQLAEILFRDILISPQITIDDFADMESFFKVKDFLLCVAHGDIFYTTKSKARLNRKVKENWVLWRLVLSQRGFDYQTVFGKSYMTPQDIAEANAALDMQLEAEKKASKAK